MQCENDFCIYWQGYQCSLSEVALDNRGFCTECIIGYNEESRKDLLARYRKEEAEEAVQ